MTALPFVTRDHRVITPGTPEADALVAERLAAALDATVATLLRYVHFTHAEQAWTVALWCAASWVSDSLSLLPRLAIRAPTRGSGKTRLLEVSVQLSRDGWGPIVGPSAAALYRKIERDRPSVFLDEVDRLFERRVEDAAAILEVINAGHIHDATVPRVIGMGTKQTVHDFPVFAPMALAGIATNWPDTVLDRSIVVTLERRKADEPIERYRMADHPGVRDVGVRLGDHMREVTLPEHVTLPDTLSDRAQDNWEPLLRIAQAAGGHWPDRASQAAALLGSAAAAIMAEDERDEVLLLGDMVAVFADVDPVSGFIGSRDFVDALTKLEARPWGDWDHGFTSNRMARLLKTLGIHPTKPFGSDRRGYERKHVEEVWARVGSGNRG